MNPFFVTDFSISDSLKTVRKSVLIYETIIKRQMNAIRSLKSEEYSARNLKDILLNVEEPEEIPTIFEPKFIAQKLNTSQQQAVIKA